MEKMYETTPDKNKILAKALVTIAHEYTSCTINGFNFHTKSYDEVDLFKIVGMLQRSMRFGLI
jgi:hypothetical protein